MGSRQDYTENFRYRPGTLLRHTATYYVPNGNYAALPVWLIRLPIQQNIYAGADNLAALTYYHYDDYNTQALTDTPGINMAGRDDAFGAGYTLRGNLTRKDSWINTSNTYASEREFGTATITPEFETLSVAPALL